MKKKTQRLVCIEKWAEWKIVVWMEWKINAIVIEIHLLIFRYEQHNLIISQWKGFVCCVNEPCTYDKCDRLQQIICKSLYSFRSTSFERCMCAPKSSKGMLCMYVWCVCVCLRLLCQLNMCNGHTTLLDGMCVCVCWCICIEEITRPSGPKLMHSSLHA